MRKSTGYSAFIVGSMIVLVLLIFHARQSRENSAAALAVSAKLVESLKLTDLSLFTEARYTRNPAMADLHAPFQDHPMALDHFPSGAIVTPPFVQRRTP